MPKWLNPFDDDLLDLKPKFGKRREKV